ncbi:MAG: MBL fold metallo-hydrolase [Synergistales bacterium]|nr:MBL fold metallo-hydrolase [Synergistales bacterium]
MFLETPRGNLLFDTGLGWSLLHNARELSVDICKIDQVVLSHGHYDHTWGLNQLLLRRGSIPVWAHEDFDKPHYSYRNMRKKYIGSSLERSHLDFRPVEGIVEVTENVWAISIPKTERHLAFLPLDSSLVVFDSEGTPEQDPLLDDLSLLVKGSRGYSVILGCAHCGVVNILEKAAHITGTRNFYTIIGGMHLASQPLEFIDRTVDTLARSFSIEKWRPNHCTGFKAALTLGKAVKNLEWASSGQSMEL